jgi:hypothetical protein
MPRCTVAWYRSQAPDKPRRQKTCYCEEEAGLVACVGEAAARAGLNGADHPLSPAWRPLERSLQPKGCRRRRVFGCCCDESKQKND